MDQGIGHWVLGSLDWLLLASLLLGSIPGIIIGSFMAVRLAVVATRLVFA